MNYIELIRKFWTLHYAHSFSTTEIALYFYMIEVFNTCKWMNQIKRNNRRVEADLDISFNTLKNARNRLQQIELLYFKSVNGNANVSYSLSKFDEVAIKVSDEVNTRSVPSKDKLNKTKLNNKENIKEKPNRFLPPSKNDVIDFFMDMENLKPSEAEEVANNFYSHHSKNEWAGVEDWHELAKTWKLTAAPVTKKSFTPPTVVDAFEYFTTEKGLSLTDAQYRAEQFILFYESKDWKIGKNKMTNWKSAATRSLEWENKRQKPGYTHPAAKHQQTLGTDKRF